MGFFGVKILLFAPSSNYIRVYIVLGSVAQCLRHKQSFFKAESAFRIFFLAMSETENKFQ